MNTQVTHCRSSNLDIYNYNHMVGDRLELSGSLTFYYGNEG
jgi:hypothetical protein